MGLALVIGGGNCVWSDLRSFFAIASPDVVITVNDVTAYYPGHVDAVVTLHPAFLSSKNWISERVEKGYNMPSRIFAQGKKNYVTDVIAKYNWPECDDTGSSGMFAVRVAMEEYNCNVVCCGIPMQAEECHFFDKNKWGEFERYWKQWPKAFDRMNGRVKSMSGNTAELLGVPTKEWCDACYS